MTRRMTAGVASNKAHKSYHPFMVRGALTLEEMDEKFGPVEVPKPIQLRMFDESQEILDEVAKRVHFTGGKYNPSKVYSALRYIKGMDELRIKLIGLGVRVSGEEKTWKIKERLIEYFERYHPELYCKEYFSEGKQGK
ncbi:hypothetical protein HYW76_00315 [Candidatus Pacearchaeota archaeon]|nr:hypothetical protein [Candidatus Pacearchaeota archaeon]